MNFFTTLLSLFLLTGVSSCQKKSLEGTWNRCNRDGSYVEYIITNEYFVMLLSKSDNIGFFKKQDIEKGMIISDHTKLTEVALIGNPDTLWVYSYSKNQVILRSRINGEIELNKASFTYATIDTLDFAVWKSKIISEFQKRTLFMNCQDIRTESEKEVEVLDVTDDKEEELLLKGVRD
ncbi:hypothetical protein POV27_08535 [Aureisphaera galaxeae]|uniref:hypothetical protein n=1 Tax=Aureisphaera galaxeae TaxID=1538023 RepID=UPI00235062D5|nr:hypothetical protein [Aureisphaera galaxeae]MDC8004098.1 hypothetical protein [Aureisphaera galaxeae]